MAFLMIDCKSFFASVEAVERGVDPLQIRLVVMRDDAATGSGLVVSASPEAKRAFGIGNVDRGYTVPNSDRLLQVPPRHWLYEQYSKEINAAYRKVFGAGNVFPYSIDESLIKLDESVDLNSADQLGQAMQRRIYHQFGIYTTVGIGNNPVQAKLALDLLSKSAANFRGTLTEANFKAVLWPIQELTRVWSIGPHTASRLNKLGIKTMQDLAEFNEQALAREFKSRSWQLHALAWAQDVGNRWMQATPVEHQSVSASKIFEVDVQNKAALERRLRKIVQSLDDRLGQRDGKTLTIMIRYADGDWVARSKTYDYYLKQHLWPTAWQMFQQYWDPDQAVRQLGVGLSKLKDRDRVQQISLF